MLELIGLRRSFDDVVALDDVSFAVPEGAIVGFVGPNGAGKTTAMRIALGVLEPDAGEVRWRGQPVDARGPPSVRLHARGARPLPEDARPRAARVPRPTPRPPAGPCRSPRGRDRGHDGRRGAGRRPRGVALPREPATRAAGRGARARARRARPRRAVLGPGPGRRGRAGRRAPAAGAEPRRAGRVLEPPARPRRADLRRGGADRPRPDRRVGDDRRAARARARAGCCASRSWAPPTGGTTPSPA